MIGLELGKDLRSLGVQPAFPGFHKLQGVKNHYGISWPFELLEKCKGPSILH